jgi:pimeloyl-ACP methyl ester carboxylesterase
VQAGDNAAAVRRLIDGVGDREGYFAAQPASVQAVQMDSAGSMPLIQSNQAPPPLISCRQLGEIKPSVAIVRGELARPFFRTIAEAAARCMPTGRYVIVPKANHMWPSADPQGFSQTLMAFLKDK